MDMKWITENDLDEEAGVNLGKTVHVKIWYTY
jgi:hypothetical protein